MDEGFHLDLRARCPNSVVFHYRGHRTGCLLEVSEWFPTLRDLMEGLSKIGLYYQGDPPEIQSILKRFLSKNPMVFVEGLTFVECPVADSASSLKVVVTRCHKEEHMYQHQGGDLVTAAPPLFKEAVYDDKGKGAFSPNALDVFPTVEINFSNIPGEERTLEHPDIKRIVMSGKYPTIYGDSDFPDLLVLWVDGDGPHCPKALEDPSTWFEKRLYPQWVWDLVERAARSCELPTNHLFVWLRANHRKEI